MKEMATTRLYLIRHGATEENERGILVGKFFCKAGYEDILFIITCRCKKIIKSIDIYLF